MAQAIDRQAAHDLIDQLSPEQVPAVVEMMQSMIRYPIDDEPMTEEERRAVQEADAWLKANGGRGIPMEEVLAEFGLTMDDFPLKEPEGDRHD